jgi:hypothetical protein
MTNLTTTKGFAPATLGEAMEFSNMLAKSAMVPKNYQGKPEDVLVAVQWGYEIGLAPMQALQNISVINGKPSVYGDAAMALVQASAVCEDIEEYFEQEGTPNPIAVCVAKRKGRKQVIAKFSVEDAKRAGLWNKQGPWTSYPKRMMQMRARGFALRDAFPDVLKGLITAEEAQDYPDQPAKDITPRETMRNPLDALAPPTTDPVVIVPDLNDINAELTSVAEIQQQEDAHVIEDTPVMDDTPVTEDIPQEVEAVSGDWMLHIPGKEASSFPTYEMWAEAYEALADKVTKAGRISPRDRMTKLRELREANDAEITKVPTLQRVAHTAAYSKRLAYLGAKKEEAGE